MNELTPPPTPAVEDVSPATSSADLPSGDSGEMAAGQTGDVTEKDAQTIAAAPPRRHRLHDVLPNFQNIEGWMKIPEAEMLFDCAAAVTEGCIVEVGSYRGRSTAALCAGSSVGREVPVYAVDPHEVFIGIKGGKFGPGDRRAFFKTMISTHMVRLVRLLNTNSRELSAGWSKKVALLFIDGDHRYEAAYSDFESWRPHLIDGATVAFDDAHDEGPKRVIEEFTHRKMLTPVKTVGKVSFFTYNVVKEAPTVYPDLLTDDTVVQKNLSLETVAYNVYYGGDGKYLYQSIPKCACTSIKTILLELEGLPVNEDEYLRHQKGNNKFPGADGLTARQQNDLFQGRTDTFKFVVVRDPYTRIVSAYQDKILMLNKRRSSFWIKMIEDHAEKQGVHLDSTISFENFVRVVSGQKIEDMDPHWRPQYFEGRFGIIKYDFVGHTEMLHCDLPYILERLEAPEHLHKKAAMPHNVTGSPMALWDDVSSDVRKAFMKTFAIDFDTLRYPYRTYN